MNNTVHECCNICCVLCLLQINVEKNLTLYKIHGPGVDKDPKGVLEINEHTGEITVCKPVDYEEYQSFTVRRNFMMNINK